MAILNPNYEFLKADYSNPNLAGAKSAIQSDSKIEKNSGLTLSKSVLVATPVLLFSLPSIALAADTSGTFNNVYNAVMNVFDYGVVLIIVFAGASWALGHRSKGIELLIGVACGYLLARNAVNIRDFLKTI